MKRISILIMWSLSVIFVSSVFAAEPNSPIGFWKTIDDNTGNAKSIIHITESANQTLSGQILKIYPRPGFDQHEVCDACKGSKHNQPIVGMVILENLQVNKKKATEWINGKILDPMNGRTYQCNVQLMDNDQKLKVRGYIGFQLFGRSQVWVRVTNPTEV
jgi:uncharacterized protein (DUF2147 family)